MLERDELVVNPDRLLDFAATVPDTPSRSWLSRALGGEARRPIPEAVPGVSMDAIWLFDLPASTTHPVGARARWDACVLAKALVEDQDWVASVSPDLDAVDFEAKVEAGVRERITALFASRRS